ncbi:UDP-N-acetylglucosamine 1-carboxyvinyltransferase [Elusimicrobiota bacterium]
MRSHFLDNKLASSATERSIIIEGPSVLRGEVKIAGSKNAVLPILAATLLSAKKCTVRNVPHLSDISTMISMLKHLGKKVTRQDSFVIIEEEGELLGEAPYNLVKKMRASVLVMGALAGRRRRIRIPLPGGCAIGTRPIDLHLKGLKKMGIKMDVSGGFVNLSSKGMKGATVYLDFPSVGATENLIMAACHAEGKTSIENAAREPEIYQLIEFLRAMGVVIEIEDNTITVEGCDSFDAVDFSVMDDRIQAGTYLIAGCLKNSKINMHYSHMEVLDSAIEKLTECGAEITVSGESLKCTAPAHLKNIEILTSPHPGFPTDLQAPMTSLMTMAEGVSLIKEDVFENRFLHCGELIRMGADIEIKGNLSVIKGVKHLSGAPVTALDLRGGASLIIAGLAAKGRTSITGIDHIERGYENIVGNLRKLGAKIWME